MKVWLKSVKFGLVAVVLVLAGCGGDDGVGPDQQNPYNAFRLDIFDSAPLETGFVYQVWAAKENSSALRSQAVSWTALAQFNVISGGPGEIDTLVDASGQRISDNTFTDLGIDFDDYDTLYVTIESAGTVPSTPSNTLYLQSVIPDELPKTSLAGMAFPFSAGNEASFYQLGTPTDADPGTGISGIWFMAFSNPVQPGLGLPEAPSGWRYEGWAFHDGVWLSMGRFVSPDGSDDFDGYSAGENAAPAFPGEDFLLNPPSGVTFPWVFVVGDSVAVTLEPHPDTDPGQFPIRYLEAELPDPVQEGVARVLNRVVNPTASGTVRFLRPTDL